MEELTAYHEAAHIVAATWAGGRVLSATIDPDLDEGPQRYGEVVIEWPGRPNNRAEIQARICVALAGPVVEMIYQEDHRHPAQAPEWAADWRDACELAARIHSNADQCLQLLEATTRQLLQLFEDALVWSTVATVADHLAAHETLEEDMITELLADWLNALP